MKKTGNSETNLRKGSNTSLTSLGFVDTKASNKSSEPKVQESGGKDTALLTPFGNTSGEKVFDCMVFVIHCTKHNTIVVSKIKKDKAVWFPFVAISPTKTYKEIYSDGVALILSNGTEDNKKTQSIPVSDMHYIQFVRIQMPETKKSILRVTCYVKLNQSNWKCCDSSNSIDWVTIDEIISNKVINVWGPELNEFVQRIKTSPSIGLKEYGVNDALFYRPSDKPRNQEEAMLNSASISTTDVLRLYSTYIIHCFPCAFMSVFSFSTYMLRVDPNIRHTIQDMTALFNAFSFNHKPYLNFHELLLGLSSLEPSSAHGELRRKFVFRYYDNDCDAKLNQSELKNLIKDIELSASTGSDGKQPLKLTDKDIDLKVSEAIKTIKGSQTQTQSLSVTSLTNKMRTQTNSNTVSEDEFVKAVTSLKLRGTSNLCRLSYSILSRINITSMSGSVTSLVGVQSHYGKQNRYTGVCMACKQKSYEYACHIVTLDPNGRCIDATKMFEPDFSEDKLDIKGYRYSSENVFNSKSIANVLMDLIRDFNENKGNRSKPKGFMASQESDRKELAKHVKYLCDCVTQIVGLEERAVRVNSPCFVIGDIHGNLTDLMSIERLLWPSVPILSSNYILLGDYVDRGKWSVECVIYLFALKILSPNKVFLLRGNHEIRQIQEMYSFYKECIGKYGQQWGQSVFDAINSVFDRLPLCAIIDESIYCAHGGIPASGHTLAHINKIPKVLADPENDSPIAWEMMWNDPSSDYESIQVADLLKKSVKHNGFLENTKRATAFIFTEQAAKNFLRTNHLSHIIRAHEVPKHGYMFHFNGMCITIFSCSHYMGQDNEAAVAHIVDGRIRIVRLDTHRNAPATDQ